MNKFNEELDELKKANQEIKLDDEFKSSLKIKLDEEISKQEEKLNKKPKLNLLPRKLIPVTVCLVVLFVTMQTFADEIESLVKCVFSNVDESVEEAIANGNYQKIDMEYVEHDGISIKVDYIIQENNNTYIAFNVLTEKKMDNVYFENIKIHSTNDGIFDIYNDGMNVRFDDKILSNQNRIVICRIINLNVNIKDILIDSVKINVNEIKVNKIWELNLKKETV